MSERPRVLVAAAVVLHEGRVLITQRPSGTHLEGLWEFPGGKLEPGESPEEALVRECREELGVELDVVDILDVTAHTYPHRDVVLFFYVALIREGTIEHRGVAAHRFVDARELDDAELPPADAPVARKIREGRAHALLALVRGR